MLDVIGQLVTLLGLLASLLIDATVLSKSIKISHHDAVTEGLMRSISILLIAILTYRVVYWII